MSGASGIARPLLRAFSATALALLAALPGRGDAQPRALNARVVWARADRVYIAAPDSLAVTPGDLLTFIERGRTVASGEVAQVLAPDLAAARLTLGSLERSSRLDRVRILAYRPPPRAMPVLRIGYPGRGRPNLLFECARPVPRPPVAAGAYRTDSLAENSYRLVHTEASPIGTPWPDTILVRLFGEATDQEIALERGELDLAVFWPGEASSRLRTDPRWRGFAHGSRSRGVLAAIAPEPGPAGGTAGWLSPDLPSLVALNDALFRGDLEPWRNAAGSAQPTHSPPESAPSAQSIRFVVDPSCPGRLPLERFLDRANPAAGPRENRVAVRLIYLDSPAGSPDSLARADSLHVTFLFTIRCPLVCEPGLGTYVNALGPDALADLLECRPGGQP